MKPDPGLDRIAIALDTDDWDEYRRWAELFGPRVGLVKVGLEAFVRWGPAALGAVRDHAHSLFLDLKLHDIPNTVAGAVRSARSHGADLVTVHVAAGRPALLAAVEAASGNVGILGVTVLTHLDGPSLDELDLPGDVAERVVRWAGVAQAAGCWGVVCSPHELRLVHSRLPGLRCVTPGIRPSGHGAEDDQRRIASPSQALADGAHMLVVGRPVTRSQDPLAALEAIRRELLGEASG